MSGVGTLLATKLHPSTCQRSIQQRLQNLLLRFSLDQALTKLTEHRGIEAWICQFQTQQIFPIEPPSNRISRWDTLHEPHERFLREQEPVIGDGGASFFSLFMRITVSLTKSPVSYPLLLLFVQLSRGGIRQWYQ